MPRFRLVRCLVLLLTLAVLTAAGADDESPVETLGRVTHPDLDEISGVAKSRTHEGVWWVHNDSGDAPRFFAIDETGAVIHPTDWEHDAHTWPGIRLLDGSNNDWEDVAIFEKKLYISDLGNNGNARKNLMIYVLEEPDPKKAKKAWSTARYPVRYPDQTAFPAREFNFDSECIFVDDGTIYVLTKHRANRMNFPASGTKLYRLDDPTPDEENVLTRVDSREDIALWPTGADLSPDGSQLAILTQTQVWLFDRPDEGDEWLSQPAKRVHLPSRRTAQAEAICWDDETTLRILNEQRGIYVLSTGAIREPVPGHRKQRDF